MQAKPELGSLRAELRAAGVFEHQELRSWLKLAFLLGGVAACLVGIATYGWVAAIPLAPIAAVFATAAAMLGHEGSHRAFSKSPVRNAFVAYLAFPLFGGLSLLYWREKHDRLHHGHPNVEGVDPDIRPFPFASSKKDHEQCGPKERWFQRDVPEVGVLADVDPDGARHAALVARPPRALSQAPRLRSRVVARAACLTAHYTGWLVVPVDHLGPAGRRSASTRRCGPASACSSRWCSRPRTSACRS